MNKELEQYIIDYLSGNSIKTKNDIKQMMSRLNIHQSITKLISFIEKHNNIKILK